MRLLSRIGLVAGVTALGLAGLSLAGVAHAQSNDTHVMNIRLPSGQIEQIRYTGDVAPRVMLAPQAAPVVMMADPFAMLRQISAEMDQQMAGMMQMIAAPMPGVAGYGPIAIAAGPGVCIRSMQITFNGSGTPHVVSSTRGDCGPASRPTGASAPAALPSGATPWPIAKPQTYEVKDTSGVPYHALVRPVSDLAG